LSDSDLRSYESLWKYSPAAGSIRVACLGVSWRSASPELGRGGYLYQLQARRTRERSIIFSAVKLIHDEDRALQVPTSAANGFLICLQPGDDSIETFPPILVFDLRNAALEIMHNAVDLP
jgi:hypothetical protein